MKFIEKLMQEIVVKGSKTPKVQVERYISPILSIFIEEILASRYDKEYKLIMPEFPIRKQTVNLTEIEIERPNQSTNIDYLLFNKTDKKFTFVELKTDASSYKKEQLQIYHDLEKICNDKSIKKQETFGQLLYDDLERIMTASSYKDKYKYLLSQWENSLNKIDEMEIIYLVPMATDLKEKEAKKHIDGKKAIPKENILYFENLSENINHIFKSEWKTIIKFMQQLDYKYKFDDDTKEKI